MLEELIKSTPVTIPAEVINEVCGLTIHWANEQECWLVGYGSRPKYSYKGTGEGITVLSAFKDFLKKQEQFKQ